MSYNTWSGRWSSQLRPRIENLQSQPRAFMHILKLWKWWPQNLMSLTKTSSKPMKLLQTWDTESNTLLSSETSSTLIVARSKREMLHRRRRGRKQTKYNLGFWYNNILLLLKLINKYFIQKSCTFHHSRLVKSYTGSKILIEAVPSVTIFGEILAIF